MSLLQKDGTLYHPPIPRPDLIRPLQEVVDETLRRTVETAMVLCAGNRALAAFSLGICTRTLYNHLQRFQEQDQRVAKAASAGV